MQAQAENGDISEWFEDLGSEYGREVQDKWFYENIAKHMHIIKTEKNPNYWNVTVYYLPDGSSFMRTAANISGGGGRDWLYSPGNIKKCSTY